jgi:hypothetical protein
MLHKSKIPASWDMGAPIESKKGVQRIFYKERKLILSTSNLINFKDDYFQRVRPFY